MRLLCDRVAHRSLQFQTPSRSGSSRQATIPIARYASLCSRTLTKPLFNCRRIVQDLSASSHKLSMAFPRKSDIAKIIDRNEKICSHGKLEHLTAINQTTHSLPTPSNFSLDIGLSAWKVKMKLNISYPANGTQKLIEVEDDRKLRVFIDRRMGQEVPGDSVGDEWKGYTFRITGGNDKQGFPMKQGVMHPTRVRLLLAKGHSCYRPRRTGERKRKSVRGCIVAADLSVLALSVVKKGDEDIPGLTDKVEPKRLGPKRASKIRRFFGLTKEDDVRKFVIRREVQPKGEGKKAYTKAPKIQRLVTPQRMQHKRRRLALKRRQSERVKDAANEYAQVLAKRVAESKEAKADARKRRMSSVKK